MYFHPLAAYRNLKQAVLNVSSVYPFFFNVNFNCRCQLSSFCRSS